MNEINFEEFFKIQMTAMELLKVHHNTKYTKYTILQISIVISVYTSYFLLLMNCIINYDMKNKNYYDVLRNIVPITYYTAMMINYCMLSVNKKAMGQLVDYIKNDYVKLSDMDAKRRTIIFDYAEKGSWIMIRWLFVTTAGVAAFVLKSMVLSIIYKLRGEYRYVQFHEMHYPNFIEDQKQTLFVFIATYIGEMTFTVITAAIAFCTVPLGLISILHACGQLELIKMKFEKLFEKDDVDERLNDIVKDLQNIYGFVKKINKCFTTMYETLLKQNMMLLSLTSFAMVQSMSHGNFTVEYVLVFLGSIFTSSMHCYYGDLLMQKGEEIRQAAYACGWEHVFNPGARKTLLIILTRALQPICIRSIFCTINLDTLTNVFRQSYTIFNVMTASSGDNK